LASEDQNPFGRRLAEAIERSGRRQTALAECLGVSANTICNWKRGDSTPRIEQLEPLARFLGVSEAWLLGHTNREIAEDGGVTGSRLADADLLGVLAALEGAEPQLRELVESIPRLIEAVRGPHGASRP
jgi:transcriptional regulator with XRE-family HTH domain